MKLTDIFLTSYAIATVIEYPMSCASGAKQHNGQVARHDQFPGHRVSITAVTSSWSNGTAGPLALIMPAGMMKQSLIDEWNVRHRGHSWICTTGRGTHFMNSSTFVAMLQGLLSDAFDVQRRKLRLAHSVRGLLLTDGWTGYHAVNNGSDLSREAWSQSCNVTLPDVNPGGWSAACQPVDQIHSILRARMDTLDASDAGCGPDLRKRHGPVGNPGGICAT